jgi:hypothetical protein
LLSAQSAETHVTLKHAEADGAAEIGKTALASRDA